MPTPYALDVRALDGTLSGGLAGGSGNDGLMRWVSLASAAASGYHGYKRNQSVGWAVGWFVLGGMFPIVTPVIAVAQGFAKPAK